MEPLLYHTCDIARNAPVGTNGRQLMGTVHTGVECLFLPMSDKSAIENQYTVGFAWNVYLLDGADVQIGDRLTWNGQTYIVRGRKLFTGLGVLPLNHIEVAAETEHANGQ